VVLIHDREQWRALQNAVINNLITINAVKKLIRFENCQFFNKEFVPWT
jgi:hypothetical protein